MDIEIRRAPVGADFRADVAAMEALIDDDTIMVVGSAPCFPYGVIDPPLQVIVSIAMPIVSAVYLGVAEAAFQAAVDAAAGKADDPIVQRQVGLMAHRLQIASWALEASPNSAWVNSSARICFRPERTTA